MVAWRLFSSTSDGILLVLFLPIDIAPEIPKTEVGIIHKFRSGLQTTGFCGEMIPILFPTSSLLTVTNYTPRRVVIVLDYSK